MTRFFRSRFRPGRKVGLVTAVLTIGAMLSVSPAARATTNASVTGIQDGDFESPVTSAPYQQINSGQSIGPWTVTSGSVDLIGSYWQAYSGVQSIDLNGCAPGTIDQSVGVTPGQSSTLTFAYAGNPAEDPGIENFHVEINGTNVGAFQFDSSTASVSDMSWKMASIPIPASTSSTLDLSFVSDTTASRCGGPALDDISLGGSSTTAVPFQSTGWSYLDVSQGTDAVGWEVPGFNDSSWPVGQAGFGTTDGTCSWNNTTQVHTTWTPLTDLLLRRHISLPAGATDVVITGTVDNTATVYWNGAQIGTPASSGFCEPNGIDFTVPAADLTTGDNVLAIGGGDDGNATFLDVQVTYTAAAAAASAPLVTVSPQGPITANARGTGTFTVTAADSDGQPVDITWTLLPTTPIAVGCTIDPVPVGAFPKPPTRATCRLKEVATGGAPVNTIVFSATDTMNQLTTTQAVMINSPTPHSYVALGDSFSSGEGNPPYDNGTNTDTDQCHRSSRVAYPRLLEKDHPKQWDLGPINFVACSGSVIQNVVYGQTARDHQEGGQLERLTSTTKQVTISIGGNNVDFSTVVPDCIFIKINGVVVPDVGSTDCANKNYGTSTGNKTLLNYELSLIDDLGGPQYCPRKDNCPGVIPSLSGLYRQISDLAPNAQIHVLLYPHLFNDAPGRADCDLYGTTVETLSGTVSVNGEISRKNILFINHGVDLLDAEIIEEAGIARAAGADVVIADPRPFFDKTSNQQGHGICSNHPWINGIHITRSRTFPYLMAAPETSHPNKSGHLAFEEAILTSS
jgi:choice-of-anchor C domain-containing protein